MTLEDAKVAVTPVQRQAGDHAASAVHSHLRALILSGVIRPGALLNQVELAPQLGVSRTPLREAIRMLQEEGLLVAEPQRRVRVTGFDPEHLEAVYVQRVLLEGMATKVTAASETGEGVERLDSLLEEMGTLAAARQIDAWEAAHRDFHVALVGKVGDHMMRAMTGLMDRAEHYRVMHQVSLRDWASGEPEHAAIVEAHRRRDGGAAASELAAHLARTALSLMAQLAPAYDPAAIRAALTLFHATLRVGRTRRVG